MPSAHIVLGHPHGGSFNAHLADVACSTLRQGGWTVTLTDLGGEGFDPREGAHHYPMRDTTTEYNIQREQRMSVESNRIPAEIQKEIERLEQADLLILHFPLWWFGAPAILKGWYDRTFVYGRVYNSLMRHDRGLFKGKRAMLCVTCGGPEETFAHNGRNGDINLLLWPLNFSLSYIGFTILKPLVFYGVQAEMLNRPVDALRALLSSHVETLRQHMRSIDAAPIVRFNGWDDWENGQLKPGVQGHSLMMRTEP